MEKTLKTTSFAGADCNHTKSLQFFFYLSLTMMFLCLLLKNFFKAPVPNLAFLILAAFACAVSTRTQIIGICICCIPLTNVMQSKYVLLISMLMYILKFQKEIKLKFAYLLPLSLMAVWEILHAFIGNFSFIEFFRQFSELFFCVFLLCIDIKQIEIKKVVRILSFSTLFICFLILLVQLKEISFNVQLFLNGKVRFGYGISEESLTVGFNPNILSAICLLSIEGLFISGCYKKNNLLDVLLVVFLAIFGLLTMSRRFISSFIIFLVLFVVFQKPLSKKLKSGILLAFLVLIIYILFSNLFPSMFYSFMDRFSVEDVSNGRNELFSVYNDLILTNPSVSLFGIGMQDFYNRTMNTFTVTNIPHNSIQETILMWGVPGLILFTWYLLTFVFYAKKNNKCFSFLNVVPFIVYLIGVQSGQWLSSSVGNLEMAALFLFMLIPINNRKKDTNGFKTII